MEVQGAGRRRGGGGWSVRPISHASIGIPAVHVPCAQQSGGGGGVSTIKRALNMHIQQEEKERGPLDQQRAPLVRIQKEEG